MIDRALVEEARRIAGPRGLSTFGSEAIEHHLQHHRLWQPLDELERDYGPISHEARRRAAVLPWPD